MSSMIGLRARREKEATKEQPIQPPISRPPVERHEEQHREILRDDIPVREQLDRMVRQEHQLRQEIPVSNRHFLIVVNDAEASEKVLVNAPNIMLALIKFGQRFHDDCNQWMNIALYVEEVETVE